MAFPTTSIGVGSALASAGIDLGKKGAQLLGQALPALNWASGRVSEIMNERPELLKDLRLSESMIDSAQQIAKQASSLGLKLCSVPQLLKNVYTIRNRIKRYINENALTRPSEPAPSESKGKVKQAIEKAKEWNNYIWPLFYRQHLAFALAVFQTSLMVYQTELQTISTELALLPTLDGIERAKRIARINADCATRTVKAPDIEDEDEEEPLTTTGPPGGPEITERRRLRRSKRLASRGH